MVTKTGNIKYRVSNDPRYYDFKCLVCGMIAINATMEAIRSHDEMETYYNLSSKYGK